MFMKWNADGTAVPNFPVPQGGTLFVDGPNLFAGLPRCSRTGHRFGGGACDLRLMRDWMAQRYDIRRFAFVERDRPTRAFPRLRDYLRRNHWQLVTIRSARYGLNVDPIDDYILHNMQELAHSDRLGSMALVSHDGGYRDAAAALLDAGWRTIVVGSLSHMSHRLLKLADRGAIVRDFADLGCLPASSPLVGLAVRGVEASKATDTLYIGA